MNVLNYYIPHESIIFDDQDPAWINSKVKKAIQEKNQLFSRIKPNINNGTLLKKLQCHQNKPNDLTDTAKSQYHTGISMKTMDRTTSAKTYWSIFKRCRNDKKIHVYHHCNDNRFTTDFREKDKLFNSFFFFLKQCSIVDNASKLPSNLVYHTNEKLSDIVFNSEDIVKVISGLDPNKAHGHDIMI